MSGVGLAASKSRDELLNGSRGNPQLTPPHQHLSCDFTASSHYPSPSSLKACQNYYSSFGEGEKGVRRK